jgi:hypothetical protein
MRRIAAVLFLAAAVAGAAAAAPTRKPSLRVAQWSPLRVAGSQFVPRETVRVVVDTSSHYVRRARAGTNGTFVAGFPVALSHCEAAEIVAVGAHGDRAQVKLLPGPACSSG